MGQFKPMVKMYTTEPSVELKLKKGGSVKKADGGMMGAPAPAPAGGLPPAMPARGGMPGAAAPMKPSLSMRRRAMRGMPAAPGPAAPVGPAASMMKKGGKAAKHEDAAQDRAMIKKALAGKKFASGGEIDSAETKTTVKGNAGPYEKTVMHTATADRAKGPTGAVKEGNAGGYKRGGKVMKKATGGAIPSESSSGTYATTEVHSGKYDSASGTGGVKMGNAGGFKTGGVAESNAGGYKKGGAAKKAYATGGLVDDGRPVAMPQGRKAPSKPVSINQLSGTFKKGGSVTSAEGRLMKANKAENATAMRQAKAQSNEVYSKYQKKMAAGGDVDYDPVIARENRAFKNWEKSQREENEGMRDAILGAPKRLVQGVKSLFGSKAPAESVTKTKESVTVTPGKKRGGRC